MQCTWMTSITCLQPSHLCPIFEYLFHKASTSLGQATSWHSSPPHWLSQKRNRVHVKPPSLSYFINFVGLCQPGGLMVSMLARVNEFSWILVSLVFDSWWMYIFLVGSNLAFLWIFGYFYFLLVSYFSLCSSLILLDIKSSELIKIALISN